MSLPRVIKTRLVDDVFDLEILLLGRCGENLATRIIIDATEWHAQGGTYVLIVKRADSELFTATIEQHDDVITWDIPAAEIGAPGYGEIELNYVVDGTVKAKSARCDTRVFSSLEIDSVPPSGLTYTQLVIVAVSDAIKAANAAADAEKDANDSALSASTSAKSAQAALEKCVEALRLCAEYAKQAEAAAGSASSAAQSAADAEAARKAADNAKNQAIDASTSAKSSADDALKSKTAAKASEDAATKNAAEAKTAAQEIKSNIKTATDAASQAVNARNELLDVLACAQIRDTSETSIFDSDGRISRIVHSSNVTGETVRTDNFAYSGDIVTETRTTPNGEKQVNEYDMLHMVFKYNVEGG